MKKSLDVPYIAQKQLYCGLACMSMVLQYHRRPFSQDTLASVVKDIYGYDVSDTQRDDPGIEYWQLATIPAMMGCKVQTVYNLTFEDITQNIETDHPLIARHGWGDQGPMNAAHFVVLRGYDQEQKTVMFHDPYYPERKEEPFSEFEKLWHVYRHKFPSKNYGIILL
ncbi:MAG: C39 family peptidase [Nanoarchaeota archaeon]|nr:C39 family peptidase [Nanoarchaeota archaeon]